MATNGGSEVHVGGLHVSGNQVFVNFDDGRGGVVVEPGRDGGHHHHVVVEGVIIDGGRSVSNVSVRVVSQRGQVVTSSELNNDTVLVVLEDFEVDSVGVCVPHGCLLLAGTSVRMRNDDEFAVSVVSQLFLEPEHLVSTGGGGNLFVSQVVVVERVQGQNGDVVIKVESVVTTLVKRSLNLSLLSV